jgi:sec-independent protein translocase protein TatA
MPSLGPAEILVILVVALLVFGPNKMPEIGRQVARGVREFRRVQQHLSSELQSVVSDLDPTAPTPANPATASSGGDTVPTLPPKDITETSAAEAPGHDADPPVDLDPGPPAAPPAPSGEPATPPPADTA